jgi:hypothetical protein
MTDASCMSALAVAGAGHGGDHRQVHLTCIHVTPRRPEIFWSGPYQRIARCGLKSSRKSRAGGLRPPHEEVSSMTSSTVSSPDLWPEQWAIQVAVDAERVAGRMRVARANGAAGHRFDSSVDTVTHHLEEARAACKRSRRRRGVRGMSDRWRGTSVDRAFRNLHSAKIALVDILPAPDVAVLVPEVCTRMAAALDRNDLRRVEAEKAMQSTCPEVRRAALKQAMEISYDASDEKYVRLRDFRNILLVTAATIALFTAILLFVVALSPAAIPLCFEPGVTSSTVSSASNVAGHVCPSGEQQTPTPGDVLIIAGLGAVGGGLSALLAIRNLRGSSTPYGVTMALAVLKVPSGALIALIGVLLLAGGFVPGLSNLDSQRQILAYALLFGYAQQLITRLADDQAQTILNRLPSKDPDAMQPAVTTTVEPPVNGDGRQPNGRPVNGVPLTVPDAVPTNGSHPAPPSDPAVVPARSAHVGAVSGGNRTPAAVDSSVGVRPTTPDQHHDADPTPASQHLHSDD